MTRRALFPIKEHPNQRGGEYRVAHTLHMTIRSSQIARRSCNEIFLALYSRTPLVCKWLLCRRQTLCHPSRGPRVLLIRTITRSIVSRNCAGSGVKHVSAFGTWRAPHLAARGLLIADVAISEIGGLETGPRDSYVKALRTFPSGRLAD